MGGRKGGRKGGRGLGNIMRCKSKTVVSRSLWRMLFGMGSVSQLFAVSPVLTKCPILLPSVVPLE